MRVIYLTQEKLAFVDDEFYEPLNQLTWCFSQGYATRKIGNQTVFMHHCIIGKPDIGFDVDHIDGNKLNNQKTNLRFCTRSQNTANRGANKNNKSGYKGVSWNKNTCKWRATIVINAKQNHLGLFNTKEQAAEAYNVAAKQLFGEFALLNVIDYETPTH